MPFSLDDMLDTLGLGGQKKGRECYREEMATLGKASKDEVAKLFPGVTLSESSEVLYAPFRLCHSLPKINARGRCFTPKVLANSFASARDAVMNIDHQMKYRGQAGSDTICGHIVCGRFDPDGVYEEVASKELKLPTDPIPLMALAAFYLRSQHIPTILQEHLSSKRKWMTSMECAHDWDEAAFFYRGELIPIKDAEQGMRQCVTKTSVKPYKGHELALALGGLEGKVDFHAAALTPDPADDDAKIMAFITRDEYHEAANKGEQTERSPFFFPLETRVFDLPPEQTENLSEVSEDELANIGILGQTEPCTDDGHMHDVLTDGSIMSQNGHTHHMASMNISRGSNPRLTGRTGSHYQTTRNPETGRESSQEHLHFVNIPLRGKGTKPNGTKGDATSNKTPIEHLPVPVPNPMEFPMDKLFERMLAVLAAGKFEGPLATEVASLSSELRKTGQDNAIKQMIQTEIANQIAAGELVKKDEHDKQVAEAVKAEQEKAAKEKEENDKRTSRREQVLGLGLKLEDKFNEKLELTVGEYVDSFGLDDSGEKHFQVALATLESVAKLAEQPAATEQLTGTETTAANKGKKGGEKGSEQANGKRKMLLVGRSDDEGKSGEEEANKGQKPVGRKAIFKTAVG